MPLWGRPKWMRRYRSVADMRRGDNVDPITLRQLPTHQDTGAKPGEKPDEPEDQ